MRLLCAHYVLHSFWEELDGPTMRMLCAYSAPTMCLNRFGFNAMCRRCTHCAPTMCPLCVHYVFHPCLGKERWADDAPNYYVPTMRLVCAHFVSNPFWVEIDGAAMRPQCGYYAPTMRSLCVSALTEGDIDAPTMRRPCASSSPAMCLNRFGFKSMGRQSTHYAPNIRHSV